MKDFLKYTEKIKKELFSHKNLAVNLKCEDSLIDYIDKVIELICLVESKVINDELKINYLNQFKSHIEQVYNSLPYKGTSEGKLANHEEDYLTRLRSKLIESVKRINHHYEQLKFNLVFFEKIGFFKSNIVAIGANGSGKTSLSNKFKEYLGNNGVVISAQRILLIPNFDNISNPTSTASALEQSRFRDKTNKDENSFRSLEQDFQIILRNLLSENNSASNRYRRESLELGIKNEPIMKPILTNLDKTIKIWNSLMEHRKIDCIDGMNITVIHGSGAKYRLMQMSDGEKVMLYLIAQVLQAPQDGFIVVDEPEMYLHKTILKKLWDILEKEREDCIYIYLSHDLDFATSRITAKKVWLKSFIYPNTWDIVKIENNEIPESLFLELLGSRKSILFCEGEKGSIDERIYSILFSNFTITPVGSCFNVINYTKAFNKISDATVSAYGMIDSDYHDISKLVKLKTKNIYSFNLAEAENLFLDEDFLRFIGEKTYVNDFQSAIDNIKKEVIAEFNKLKEIQISNYLTSKINYHFKNSHVSKGNYLNEVVVNYEKFTNVINIEKWYDIRKDELELLIIGDEYKEITRVFNNKHGLPKIVNKNFKISDFIDRSITILKRENSSHQILYSYFPEEIVSIGK